MVNYHFKSKLGLYRHTVLAGIRELGFERPPEAAGSPLDALEQWLSRFLEMTLIRRHNHPYLGSIIEHELREPTEILDEVVNAVIKPMHRQFAQHLARRRRADPGAQEIRQLAAFALSFCANLETSRAVLERLGLKYPRDKREMAAFAKVVSAFVLTGALTPEPERTRKGKCR